MDGPRHRGNGVLDERQADAARRPLLDQADHALGPRGYLLGRRVHEWQLGLVAIALGGAATVEAHSATAWMLCLLGAWLFAKDWRDLFPSKRNTAAWGLLPHRVRRK